MKKQTMNTKFKWSLSRLSTHSVLNDPCTYVCGGELNLSGCGAATKNSI